MLVRFESTEQLVRQCVVLPDLLAVGKCVFLLSVAQLLLTSVIAGDN